jgi:colanic acid/amylovoran biosynthesis glycosyltransferase
MSPRVVLVVPEFPRLSETFIVNKFLGLLSHGFDVHVVAGRSRESEWWRNPKLADLGHARSRVHALKTATVCTAALRAAGRSAAYLRGCGTGHGALGWKQFLLDSPILALRPDIVHFEFGTLARGRTHLKRQSGCKLTVSFRGFDLNFAGLEDPEYYGEVWRHVDAVHCLGEDLWRRAQRRGCPPEMPHMLIPPAIDLNQFRYVERRRERDEPLRILSVGRLEWKKGYEYALLAIRALRSRGVNCQYRIVGEGGFLEPVAFCRHALGLEDCVEIVGALPVERVVEEMHGADVLLHAAVSEGFCNAVVEAQATGLPVVCSDADGLGENAAHGETGFVVPRRNPEALADVLRRLAQDTAMRLSMGRRGRARVARLFRLEDQIEAFGRFYRAVAAGQAPAHSEVLV